MLWTWWMLLKSKALWPHQLLAPFFIYFRVTQVLCNVSASASFQLKHKAYFGHLRLNTKFWGRAISLLPFRFCSGNGPSGDVWGFSPLGLFLVFNLAALVTDWLPPFNMSLFYSFMIEWQKLDKNVKMNSLENALWFLNQLSKSPTLPITQSFAHNQLVPRSTIKGNQKYFSPWLFMNQLDFLF